MALVSSTMLPLGSRLKNFMLKDARDRSMIELDSYRQQQPILIAFVCNHCPYVVHILDHLVAMAHQYQTQVKTLFISSNDVENYPLDSYENMHQLALEKKFQFPYCFDELQQVAKDYQAECTPDLYLFDADGLLYYRGRFDDSTPGNKKAVTGDDLKHAIDELLAGNSSPEDQRPSCGCSIKWLTD